MKVAVVCHDMSNNCLGRADVIARLLASAHDVVIIGPSTTNAVWAPLATRGGLDHIIVPLERSITKAGQRLLEAVEPDLFYAIKPRATSFGAAKHAAGELGVPVVADIDDWEMSFFYDAPKWFVRNLDLRLPNNAWATAAASLLVSSADALTVSSSWLQRRYGGTIIPHARDGSELNPAKAEVDRVSIRRSMGFDADSFVVLFMGSARPSKGVADVVAAIDQLNDSRMRFLVVGGPVELPDREWLVQLGAQPFDSLPRYLGAADAVVLAQKRRRSTRGQVPAKVFDAMATGKPVIVTDVSDLADIVSGCGIVVPPNNVDELACAIESMVADRRTAKKLGERGYEKFVERFSVAAVRPRIEQVLSMAIARFDNKLVRHG